MPSTGTPSAKIFLSGNGAFLAYTLDGPPDKMMPRGASAAISTAGVSWHRMTEYTLHSRMRRAITCVYCDPKSKMTICSVMRSKLKTHSLPVWCGFGERKMFSLRPDSAKQHAHGSSDPAFRQRMVEQNASLVGASPELDAV